MPAKETRKLTEREFLSACRHCPKFDTPPHLLGSLLCPQCSADVALALLRLMAIMDDCDDFESMLPLRKVLSDMGYKYQRRKTLVQERQQIVNRTSRRKLKEGQA